MSGLEDSIENAKETVSDTLEVSTFSQNLLRGTFITIVVLLVLFSSLAFYWDHEPDMFDVRQVTEQQISKLQTSGVTGSTTVATMITMADVLLYKRGGYLHNDIILPSVLMDNLPNWEFGVLVQIRDMARTLRNNLSRSQSQSTEDADLVKAEGSSTLTMIPGYCQKRNPNTKKEPTP